MAPETGGRPGASRRPVRGRPSAPCRLSTFAAYRPLWSVFPGVNAIAITNVICEVMLAVPALQMTPEEAVVSQIPEKLPERLQRTSKARRYEARTDDTMHCRAFHRSDLQLAPHCQAKLDSWKVCLAAMAAGRPDPVAVGGDTVTDDPDDDEIHRFTHRRRDRLPVCLVTTPGDHDLGDSPPNPYWGQSATAERRARCRYHANFPQKLDCTPGAGQFQICGLTRRRAWRSLRQTRRGSHRFDAVFRVSER